MIINQLARCSHIHLRKVPQITIGRCRFAPRVLLIAFFLFVLLHESVAHTFGKEGQDDRLILNCTIEDHSLAALYQQIVGNKPEGAKYKDGRVIGQ